MDRVTTQVRSRMMGQVRSRDTRPERIVRSYLHRAGLRFRLHCDALPGKPDIVLPRFRVVIFVNGCFWHQHPGCRKASLPQANRDFWRLKLEGNRARDLECLDALEGAAWRTRVVWECEIGEELLDGLVGWIINNSPP